MTQDQSPESVAEASPGVSAGIEEPAIAARGLAKFYGTFRAIENVDFQVDYGTVTAFLGPNGAGKSTTIKILTGVLAPSAGQAIVAGHDMATDRLAASETLGYLGENGPLYPEMTPASYLAYIADIRGIAGQQRVDALARVSEECQLADVWHKPIRKLSKGFRQRVGLAQALLHDPRVLILDEPTTGLDPNQIRVVRDLITRYAKNHGKAVLLSTHILQEVEAIADRVILVHKGTVRFQGTPAELADQKDLEVRFHELTEGGAA